MSEHLPQPLAGTEHWHFFIPAAFSRALQKGSPSFSVGDTFYDSVKGYLPWKEALSHIKRAITVEQALGDTVVCRIHHIVEGVFKTEPESRKMTTPDFLHALQSGHLD